jgi:isovaleryl-CoA dehydrogenase
MNPTEPNEADLFQPSSIHKDLRETISRFGRERIAAQAKEFDEAEGFNLEMFRSLGQELSLFGITLPEADGGHGLDATASVIVHEEMSKYDPGFALSYLAHEVLFVNNLGHSASKEQKERYLPGTLDGSKIAGMAMTEPEAGTDVLAMKTTARKQGDHYILNGTKQFITNGPYGDYFLVYGKLDGAEKEVTAFIVDKNFPGFSVGPKEQKMGMKASPTSQLIFEDMQVPTANLIGEEHKATLPMMRNLEMERITLAAQSLGIAARSLEVMISYAMERTSFGKPIMSHGQVENLITHAYAQYRAARALVYEVAGQIAPQRRNSLGAASAKYTATTMAEEVARAGIQVLGGYGYTREYELERLYRDAVLLSIGGGTNEAMKKNIASDFKKIYRENRTIHLPA